MFWTKFVLYKNWKQKFKKKLFFSSLFFKHLFFYIFFFLVFCLYSFVFCFQKRIVECKTKLNFCYIFLNIVEQKKVLEFFFFTNHHNSSPFTCIWILRLLYYVVQELRDGTDRPTARPTARPTDRLTNIVDYRRSCRPHKYQSNQNLVSEHTVIIK